MESGRPLLSSEQVCREAVSWGCVHCVQLEVKVCTQTSSAVLHWSEMQERKKSPLLAGTPWCSCANTLKHHRGHDTQRFAQMLGRRWNLRELTGISALCQLQMFPSPWLMLTPCLPVDGFYFYLKLLLLGYIASELDENVSVTFRPKTGSSHAKKLLLQIQLIFYYFFA